MRVCEVFASGSWGFGGLGFGVWGFRVRVSGLGV